MSTDAEQLLRTYDGTSIQQLAKQRGVKIGSTAKEKLIPAIAPTLFSEFLIKTALDGLSEVERLVLDRVALAGGSVRTEELRQQLQAEGLVDPQMNRRMSSFSGYRSQETGTLHNRQSSKFEDIVLRLGILNLLFTAEPYDTYKTTVSFASPGRRLFIPEPVLKLLPPVELHVVTAPEPASVTPADAPVLLRDVYNVVSFVGRETTALTVKGLIVKRTLLRIAESLQRKEDTKAVRAEDELAWLPLVRALAEERDLLVTTSGALLHGSQAADFLRLPGGERLRRLFDAYRTTRRWNELYRIPGLRITGKGGSLHMAHPRVVAARERIINEVAELPPETWIPLSHLIDRLRQRAYELLLPRETVRSYYYGYDLNPYHQDVHLGVKFDVDDEESGWNIVEAWMIRIVVTEALHALGIVDLGTSADDAIVFQVTSNGALLLQGETPPSTEQSAEVIVQPNFQVFAFAPTGEDVLFTLDQIAERVRTGLAMEYELTRDSVYRAQRAGLDTAAIIGFLERVSKVGVPQNVRRTLEEWGELLERITVRPRVALLQAADCAALDELCADPEVGPLLGRRVTATTVLVPSANLRVLSASLVAREVLPALTEGPDTGHAARIDVDGDGRVSFHEPLPSIFVLHAIQPFVETHDGGFQITPTSLRSAAKADLDADAIVAVLKHLSGGHATEDAEALVRRWAKDWGNGALVEGTLFQVERAETLSDLLADPETRPLLEPLPGAPTFALVRKSNVKELRTLLEARGMTLGNGLIR